MRNIQEVIARIKKEVASGENPPYLLDCLDVVLREEYAPELENKRWEKLQSVVENQIHAPVFYRKWQRNIAEIFLGEK